MAPNMMGWAPMFTLTKLAAVITKINEQVCRSSLSSSRNVRWPRRIVPMGSHGEYADGTDGRTDARTSNRYITLSARRGQHSKKLK